MHLDCHTLLPLKLWPCRACIDFYGLISTLSSFVGKIKFGSHLFCYRMQIKCVSESLTIIISIIIIITLLCKRVIFQLELMFVL